jgi:hypothetical protein
MIISLDTVSRVKTQQKSQGGGGKSLPDVDWGEFSKN